MVIRDYMVTTVICYCYQVDDDEPEEDAPLEKRKKMFTKERKAAYIVYLCNSSEQ